MTRQKATLRAISVIVAITFLWTNCIWAGGLSGFSYQISSDKLSTQTQVLRYANFANELQLGGIALSMVAQHAVENNLALHQEWEGRGGISEGIRSALVGRRAGFKIGFSGSSVYVVRGAFLHRYSIDNQTEDPLYISARLREYENNPQVKIFDDDVVLAGQNRRLKIFLITPEILPYLRDVSQFMVGDLAEVLSAQISTGIEQIEHSGRVLGAFVKDNFTLVGDKRLSSDGSVMDVELRSAKKGARDRVVDAEAPSRFIYIKRGKIRVTYLNPQGVATTSTELDAGSGILLGTGYKIEYLEDSVILDANDTKKSDISGQGIVIDGSCDLAGRRFKIFTPDSSLLLSGIFTGRKGVVAPLHYHTPRAGEAQPRPEAIMVLEGRAKLDIYSKDWQHVRTVIVESGDIVYLSEAHQYEFLEDTKFMEVKPGPYPGSDALDKVIRPEPQQVPAKYQNLVIVINSQHGAGKSSLTHYVANKTGLPIFSAGEMKRRMAQDRGMSIEEFNEYLDQHPDEKKAVNDAIDRAQLEAIRRGGVIIDSSFGASLVERERSQLTERGIRIFKVFVKADLDVRARRVIQGKRAGDESGNVDEVGENLRQRDLYDQRQFLDLSSGSYDIFDESNYDIVFDNTHTVIEDVERFADRVVDGLQYHGKVKRIYGDRKRKDVDVVVKYDVTSGGLQYRGPERLTKVEEENLSRSLKNWLNTIPPEKRPKEVDILITENIDEIAQHRPSIIELHTALLRAPPGISEAEQEEYRLFTDGVVWHEGYHFLNPTLNEEQATKATLRYFRNRTDILKATIKILKPETRNRFYVVNNWLKLLTETLEKMEGGDAEETPPIEMPKEADSRQSAERRFKWTRHYLNRVLVPEGAASKVGRLLRDVISMPDSNPAITEEELHREIDRMFIAAMPGGITVEFFKKFYFGLHRNFRENFTVFSRIYGSEQNAMESIIAESQKTGYSIIQTVCGSLDKLDRSDSLLGLEPTKEGPSELHPDFVYVGGGGQGATILSRSFVSWLRELPYILKKEVKDIIVVNIFAISDDGGSSGIIQVELRQHPDGTWSVYFFSPGDAASILGRLTDNDIKVDLLIYESLGRLKAEINVNEATMEQLLTIFSKREADGIMDYRISMGNITNVHQIEHLIDRERFKKIKDQLIFMGGTVCTVEELLVRQLKTYKEKVERGEVIDKKRRIGKDGIVRKLPDDWNYFIANNLTLARIIDREFIQTGIIKISDASWKNLLMIGYLMQNGMICKAYGQNGEYHPAEMRNLDDLAGLLKAVGAFGGMMVPCTEDEVYQAAVLEAGFMEINGDAYVYRVGDDGVLMNTRSEKLKSLFNQRMVAAAQAKGQGSSGFSEGRFRHMISGESATRLNRNNRLSPNQQVAVGRRGFRYYNENGQLERVDQEALFSYKNCQEGTEILINGKHYFTISEDPEEEGKTRIRKAGDASVDIVEIDLLEKREGVIPGITKVSQLSSAGWTDLPTDTSKMYLRMGNTLIGLRSRLVEGQTFITDDIQHSPVERFIYKKPILIPGNQFSEGGRDKRGHVIKQFRTITRPEDRPKAHRRAIEAIKNARKAIISGESSLFTSVLAGLAIDGIPQAIRDRKDIPRIYVWKITTDMETAGLSLREQIERIEDAVEKATGEKIPFEDMFSHIVIANVDNVPQEVMDAIWEKGVENLAKLGEQATATAILLGSEKLSKFLPTPLYKVTNSDREFLRSRKGLVVVETSYIKPHEGRLVYDKEKLTRFLDSLADEYMYWYRQYRDRAREFIRGQEVFYPMAKLQQQLDSMVDKSDKPGHVTFYIDRGEYGIERFDIDIPKLENLEDDEVYLDFTAWYVAMYIYNRLYTLGGKRIIIDTDEQVFRAIEEKFNEMFNEGVRTQREEEEERRLHPVDEFIERVYGEKLRLERGKPGEVLSKQGISRFLYTTEIPEDKKVLGISISDRYLKVIVLQDDTIVQEEIMDWNPNRYTTVDDFIDGVVSEVRRVVGNIDEIEVIGVSWRGVVIDNEIKTSLLIAPKINAREFKNFAQRLSDRFNKKPVKIINDANAVAVNERHEFRKRGDELRNTVVFKLLGGIGGSYIDKSGVREDLLTELGNAILDLPYEAARHTVTGVPGVFQQYLTRDILLDIAKKAGLELAGDTIEDKIENLREKYESGDERSRFVYETFARYLAWAIVSLYQTLDIENIVLTGGLVFGTSGGFLRDEVEKNLKELLPSGKVVKVILGVDQDTNERIVRLKHAKGAALAVYADSVMRNLIKKIKDDARDTGGFKGSMVINETFRMLEENEEFTDEVRIAFVRGDRKVVEFKVYIPRQEWLSGDEEFRRIIETYLVRYIYNRLSAFGAERVYVDNEMVYGLLKDWYEYENMSFMDIKRSSDPRKPYWGMTDYLNMVYECRERENCGKLIELRGTEEIGSMAMAEMVLGGRFEKRGNVIGLDIGGSDIKVVVFNHEGAIVYYEKMKWTPKLYTTAQEHLDKIFELLDKAIREVGRIIPEGIGISINLALNGERITGKGPVVEKLSGEQAREFQRLGELVRERYSVPVSIINDGDAGAFWSAQDMGLKDVLFLALGTGLAAGYADTDGNVTGILGEMGNISIDLSRGAARHSVTGMGGAAQMYLSQRPIIDIGRLVSQQGIDIFQVAIQNNLITSANDIEAVDPQVVEAVISDILANRERRMPQVAMIETEMRKIEGFRFEDLDKVDKLVRALRERRFSVIREAYRKGLLDDRSKIRKLTEAKMLEVFQWLLENGTQEQKDKCRFVLNELGKYLAEFIGEVRDYLPDTRNIVISGRVTKGESGRIIKESADAHLLELGIEGVELRFPEVPSGVVILRRPHDDEGKSVGEIYKGINQAIGAAYFAMQRIQNSRPAGTPQAPETVQPRAHPVSRAGEDRKEERLFAINVSRTKKLKTKSFAPQNPKFRYYNQQVLERVLGKLAGIYGMGVYRFIQNMEIVDNINGLRVGEESGLARLVNNRVKIDIDVFRSEALLYDVLEHEFVHNILSLLGITEGLEELTATYTSVMRFLNEEDGYRDGILGVLKAEDNGLDTSGEYARLLERLMLLKAKGRLTDAMVVSAVVRYVLTTARYEHLRAELGIVDVDEWRKAVEQTRERMESALEVYDDLIRAKYGVEAAKDRVVTERITSQVDLQIRVVKTFRGIKINGLERLEKGLARIIAALVKVASKRDRLATELQGVKTEERYCIVLDRGRQTEEMEEDIRRIQGYKTTTGDLLFEVVSSLSEAQARGFTGRNIIHLVDPGDIRNEGNILYLPMPYLRSSLYMAAMVVIAGGKVSDVNPLVMELLFSLYPGLAELTPAEQGLLFTEPWSRVILPSIESVIREINYICMALDKIEEAA